MDLYSQSGEPPYLNAVIVTVIFGNDNRWEEVIGFVDTQV